MRDKIGRWSGTGATSFQGARTHDGFRRAPRVTPDFAEFTLGRTDGTTRGSIRAACLRLVPPFEGPWTMAKRKEQEPIEFEDDYEIDLRDNIDDESDTEGSGGLQFTITSYGADYPVETIVNRLNSNAFFVPPFQRNFVWSQRHASRFIESKRANERPLAKLLSRLDRSWLLQHSRASDCSSLSNSDLQS
jgi:hypothetical protein